MRCAIIHYWLIGMRGGERVLEALCRLFPNAEIFSLFYEPERVSPLINSHSIHTSFLNPFSRFHRYLLPVMPLALERFDLRSYDLVISSESGPAKGVITASGTHHICYCHSPMRYLWDLHATYLYEWTTIASHRWLITFFSNYLRLWDYASAARVDDFIANSANVQKRIWKTYRRASDIIYPPVDTRTFYHAPADDYFLIVSALVEYKRISDAVACFSRTGHRLKIVGEGPQYRDLKSRAGSNIEFCGRVSEAELRGLYAHSRAVVVPGEEDFGIVPVEALASGKPVIALGCGGVLESVPVRNPRAGFFYPLAGPEHLAQTIEAFEAAEANVTPVALQQVAERFSTERFMREMRKFVGDETRSELKFAARGTS